LLLTPGELLQNRYRIVAHLGQGGMGAVYRAWDLRLKVTVALKEQIPQPGLDAGMLAQLRQQFEQEAVTLARLSHPNLVRVTDFFEEGGNAYLVMDFVEGDNLADRISGGDPAPEALVVTYARQLLDALAYCHSEGIVHRDIKPQNIILKPDGRAVLVDFGLVKLWNPDDPQTRTVMRGMGTPEYAPPEQYGKQGHSTDPRSDLYSLGATLYHALTGQAPPPASDRMADPQSFKPVRALNPQVSAEMDAAILRALEPARDRRWSSAIEMGAALAGVVASEAPHHPAGFGTATDAELELPRELSGTAVMPQAQVEPRSAARRRFLPWVWVSGAVVLLLLLWGGLSTLSGDMRATPTPEPTSSPTQEQSQTWMRPADGMVMVYIPAGEFQMGSADGEDDEEPVHAVEMADFWLDRIEVTHAQYERCVTAGACKASDQVNSSGINGPMQPVVGIAWFDALAYCTWVGGRLPTEAEWEYAARGPQGLKFPWGNGYDGARVNSCDVNCGSEWADKSVNDGYVYSAPSGNYPAGASWAGVLDMSGNVAEWVADWYGPYSSERQTNPTGPTNGEGRVVRGGSWGSDVALQRSADRFYFAPSATATDIGFRCVLAAAPGQ